MYVEEWVEIDPEDLLGSVLRGDRVRWSCETSIGITASCEATVQGFGRNGWPHSEPEASWGSAIASFPVGSTAHRIEINRASMDPPTADSIFIREVQARPGVVVNYGGDGVLAFRFTPAPLDDADGPTYFAVMGEDEGQVIDSTTITRWVEAKAVAA